MNDLSTIRENINEIDNKIIELWKERMELCLSVAEYKNENNLPVQDTQREKELLERVKTMAGDELSDYSVSLYRTIMSLSCSYQQKHLDNK